MDFSEMLQQHRLWLDKAHAALTSKTAHDVTLLFDLKQQRINELSGQIADLLSQKDGAIQRFDNAIAHYREELARLQLEIANDEKLLQRPIQSHDEKPIEQLKKTSEMTKTAVSRPTKTAKKSRKTKI